PSPRAFPIRSDIVAVRYCGLPVAGFPSMPGPPDALVDGITSFVDAVAALPEAAPARCAAISMMPGEDRLLLQLADGTSVTVAAQMCQDVDAGGRTLDGGDVTNAFMAALDAQRDAFAYTAESADALTCQTPVSSGPVRHWRDDVVEAVFCPAGVSDAAGTPITDDSLDELADAWTDAVRLDPMADCVQNGEPSSVLARTNRGDVVRLTEGACGHLEYYGWEGEQRAYWVKVLAPRLIAS
ncbi:MAG: hypothetical protein M3237_06035, partial [Actinomycetota bacterium]|nr:hypothetical protein [Actinomycetota bacterium]